MRSMFESETGFRSLICNYNLELACTDGWGKNTDFLTPIPIIYQQISSCSIHSLIWKQHLLFHSLRQRFYSEYSNTVHPAYKTHRYKAMWTILWWSQQRHCTVIIMLGYKAIPFTWPIFIGQHCWPYKRDTLTAQCTCTLTHQFLRMKLEYISCCFTQSRTNKQTGSILPVYP